MTGCASELQRTPVVAGTGTTGAAVDGGQANVSDLASPQGVAVDTATGDVYIADTVNKRVRKVTVSTGVISSGRGNDLERILRRGVPGAVLEPEPPERCRYPQRTVYIADTQNNMIRRIAPASRRRRTRPPHWWSPSRATRSTPRPGMPATAAPPPGRRSSHPWV